MAKEKKERFKSLKRFGNTLWFIGTILAILLVILAVVVSMVNNYNANKKDKVLAQLQIYNYEKFGYLPQSQSGNAMSILDLKSSVSDELRSIIDGLGCEVKVLDTFSIRSLRVIEPEEDVDSVAAKLSPLVDYWEIVKSGISYYGVPNSPTLDIDSINLIKGESNSVDEFLDNLENAMMNQTTGISIYLDTNYGMMPVTGSLYTLVINDWSRLERSDQLLIILSILKETGQYTNKLDNLYDLYYQLM